jgi:hypothetical protein
MRAHLNELVGFGRLEGGSRDYRWNWKLVGGCGFDFEGGH